MKAILIVINLNGGKWYKLVVLYIYYNKLNDIFSLYSIFDLINREGAGSKSHYP
jgi:hypothetical protein